MSRVLPTRAAALVGLALAACAAPPSTDFTPDDGAWLSAHQRDHPLSGRIWQPAQARFVAPADLVEDVAGARFAILGEKHDNADHHRIQAWLLERILAGGRRPAVAFEMFTTEDRPALAAYLAQHPRDAAGLGKAVNWDKRGWPEWRHYRPIAQAALDAGAPVLAADLARPTTRTIAKEGVAALGAATVQDLGLDRDLPPALAARMRQEIVVSHCNELPESMVGPMTTVMMARDAHMAGVLRDGAARPGRDGAVLITGKGHGRTDHGVPFHLRRLAPGAATLSVALVEVAPGESDPAAYTARFDAEALPFDYVWFTPYPEREEACERFADQLRKAKERHLEEREAD